MPPLFGSTCQIYEATRATDGSGAVYKGALLSQAHAEARRQAGLDIVVCGPDALDNRLLAYDIESAAGPVKIQTPHLVKAGPMALPHCQQRTGLPDGHSFYETGTRKAV
jgi:hypothetical protein